MRCFLSMLAMLFVLFFESRMLHAGVSIENKTDAPFDVVVGYPEIKWVYSQKTTVNAKSKINLSAFSQLAVVQVYDDQSKIAETWVNPQNITTVKQNPLVTLEDSDIQRVQAVIR